MAHGCAKSSGAASAASSRSENLTRTQRQAGGGGGGGGGGRGGAGFAAPVAAAAGGAGGGGDYFQAAFGLAPLTGTAAAAPPIVAAAEGGVGVGGGGAPNKLANLQQSMDSLRRFARGDGPRPPPPALVRALGDRMYAWKNGLSRVCALSCRLHCPKVSARRPMETRSPNHTPPSPNNT